MVTDKEFVKKSAALFASTKHMVQFICEANDLDF